MRLGQTLGPDCNSLFDMVINCEFYFTDSEAVRGFKLEIRAVYICL